MLDPEIPYVFFGYANRNKIPATQARMMIIDVINNVCLVSFTVTPLAIIAHRKTPFTAGNGAGDIMMVRQTITTQRKELFYEQCYMF